MDTYDAKFSSTYWAKINE